MQKDWNDQYLVSHLSRLFYIIGTDMTKADDGIAAILAVLTQHLTCADVQECGWLGLTYLLANNNVSRVAVAWEGGISVLLAGLQQNTMNADVQ